jgi:hypothetical protein
MKNDKSNFGLLITTSALFATIILGYLVLVREGICSAVMDSGAADCSIASRIGFLVSNPPVAVIFLIVSVFGGSMLAAVLVRFLDHYRN